MLITALVHGGVARVLLNRTTYVIFTFRLTYCTYKMQQCLQRIFVTAVRPKTFRCDIMQHPISKNVLISLSSVCFLFYLATRFHFLSIHLTNHGEQVHILIGHQVQVVENRSQSPNQSVQPVRDNLTVHYVRLYKDPTNPVPLNTLDCLSAYSSALNLSPHQILIHTNNATFNPLDPCSNLLNITINWPPVRVIAVQLLKKMNNKTIHAIQHEADIRKLKSIEEYGGLVLDFDVYVINGALLRSLMQQHACIVCHEVDKVNAGFLGCRTAQARYPQLVLESYRESYNPDCWLCDSGEKPYQILRRNNDTAALVDGICDHDNGMVRVCNWATLPAFHSYWHDSPVNLPEVRKLTSTLGSIFRWVLQGTAPASLAGKVIPME